jgi:hypothetical protein
VDANSISFEQLKSEFKSRISFIHLVSSLIPEGASHLKGKSLVNETGAWVDTASEMEIRGKARTVIGLLDKLVTESQKRLPLKQN